MHSTFPKSLKTLKDRPVPPNTLTSKENLNPNYGGTEKKMTRKVVPRELIQQINNQKLLGLTSTKSKVFTIRSEKLGDIKKFDANTTAPLPQNESSSNSAIVMGQDQVQIVQRVRNSEDPYNMKSIQNKIKVKSQRFMQARKSQNMLRDAAKLFPKHSRLNSCQDQILSEQTKPQPADSCKSTARRTKMQRKRQSQEETEPGSDLNQIFNRPHVPKIDLRKNVSALDDEVEKLESSFRATHNGSHLNTQRSIYEEYSVVPEAHVQVQQTEPSKESTTEFHTSEDPFRNPYVTGLSSSRKQIVNKFENNKGSGINVPELQNEEHLMAMLEFMHFKLNKDQNFQKYSNHLKSHYKQPSNRAILDLVVKILAFYKND